MTSADISAKAAFEEVKNRRDNRVAARGSLKNKYNTELSGGRGIDQFSGVDAAAAGVCVNPAVESPPRNDVRDTRPVQDNKSQAGFGNNKHQGDDKNKRGGKGKGSEREHTYGQYTFGDGKCL